MVPKRKRSNAMMHVFKDNLVIVGGILFGRDYTMNTTDTILIYNMTSGAWSSHTCPGTRNDGTISSFEHLRGSCSRLAI